MVARLSYDGAGNWGAVNVKHIVGVRAEQRWRRLARLEHLMERRPELLSSVMLRQNPHNVHEWHKRVKLFEGQPRKQILTYTEAVTTVDIAKVTPKGHSFL